MKDKHLIALDLDGTLLRDDKTISPYTKDIIHKVKEQGHQVMISTGRPFRSSEMYYHELELNTPIVNFNGAFIHHPLDHTFEEIHSPMDLEVVKEIVSTCHTYNFHNIIAEVKDEVYIHYHDEKLLEIFSLGNPKTTSGDLREFLKQAPTSLLIHAEEEDVDIIRKHLSDVHAEVIDHRKWGAPFHVIEMVKYGLNKAVGVKKVADYLGIQTEHIIAFGDEDNDIEMLEFAGVGVAMANAIDKVKSVANEITLSNEEDGIGKFLEKYLL
ncbi:MAG TPA: Cof-type HAD-IIB family hydrolase [Bacillus sp. (in: firmicutes)]|uniref:Cof-type HAD-IIB family hydrolase n=1 Tax=Bacillus litorisediminis TaxID=2922713 RepID=UPI001FAC8DA3|nr:Cof-type HAD-IIB family hydrolase [Bacillus litorisediminis]HWO75054.1 Cof-type HAD-IIB family hydrolase [Bacillus sp. (in: firmicutes)]